MLLLQATCSEPTALRTALEQAETLAKQLRVNIQVNFYANSVIISPADTATDIELAIDKFQRLYKSIDFGENQ